MNTLKKSRQRLICAQKELSSIEDVVRSLPKRLSDALDELSCAIDELQALAESDR